MNGVASEMEVYCHGKFPAFQTVIDFVRVVYPYAKGYAQNLDIHRHLSKSHWVSLIARRMSAGEQRAERLICYHSATCLCNTQNTCF